ncbi:nitrogen fixation protein NifX [Telmatospirillum sp.]|uniref:nitrogen fixation protein NifX n=1 Tax=Telmatospirillum sp. TaxID=2079197 RepID=UPI00283E5658|nr:nitrogen fixation protein NifX [Telmatospirillum sp.]MDR3437285.1 nitrogen fixation protein NifX [Telmatospirillum sp.]
MKVAFATQDLTRVDAHFGWARHLMFYDISAEGYRYLKLQDFGPLQQDGDDRKLTAKLRALKGCDLVFVTSVGVVAHARLVRQGVHAVELFAGRPIDEALERLQWVLRSRPQPWLRRRLQTEQRRVGRWKGDTPD